jgi:hypothetical protein
MLARMAMIAMTTSSSINVNAPKKPAPDSLASTADLVCCLLFVMVALRFSHLSDTHFRG